jgi:hypothetical protein
LDIKATGKPTGDGTSRGWLWLVLVGLLFCFPLFVGLGRTDLQGDEAIYSFGADVMVADGDWLTPKSCPSADLAFLEKPPLKFWIVAAPIRLGLLPDNEFGLRFWDALFGGIAFLYLFTIGRRLGGPMCGLAAVLFLFVYRPLLFEHGLRSNNMEAALVLAYCGGIAHFLMWRASTVQARARLHAGAVTLYFVLGFMTKFVAVLFLPAIFAAALLLRQADRAWLARRWRTWLFAASLAGVLIAPWFIYQHFHSGAALWEAILGSAVYTRLTSYLDPSHVQPWHFYITTLWTELVASQTEVWAVVGITLVLWRTIRTDWVEGTTVLLWLVLPVTIMSLGTSKLYHYAYPFLPPLALAGGYLVAESVKVVASALAWLIAQADLRQPQAARNVLALAWVRGALMVIGVASALLVVAIIVLDSIKLAPWGHVLLRASSPDRVLPVVVLALIALRRVGPWVTIVAALIVATLLPAHAYRNELAQLTVEHHPLRSLRDCIQRVDAGRAEATPRSPVYVEGGNVSHAVAFYLRTLGRWSRVEPSDGEVYTSLYLQPRPVLLTPSRFHALENVWAGKNRLADVPALPVIDGVMLLPGPFEACAVDYEHIRQR